MANMFLGNQEKKIPKNMDDCIKPDYVSTNLWCWCEWIEKWGKIVFWVLIVAEIILSLEASIEHKKIDIEIFIPSLLEAALYAFLEYCAYHVLALLVGALASIVQNTKITANISLYTSAKNEGIADFYDEAEKNVNPSGKTVESEEDPSSKCTRQIHKDYICEIENMNANTESTNWEIYESAHGYEAVCKHCGKTLKYIEANETIRTNYWRCLGCGKIIPNKIRTCSCGFKREYL